MESTFSVDLYRVPVDWLARSEFEDKGSKMAGKHLATLAYDSSTLRCISSQVSSCLRPLALSLASGPCGESTINHAQYSLVLRSKSEQRKKSFS